MTTDSQLIDRFGRRVTYVRMSVTDRCDFRCVYCMSEDMQFLLGHRSSPWRSWRPWGVLSRSWASTRSESPAASRWCAAM